MFPYTLNAFQKHSIETLVNGNHALVTAATGCGKSTCFQFAATYFNSKGKKLIYCSPVKSLSNQMYYNLTRKFPDISIGILTGDFKINPDANILIVTTEILCNALFNYKTKNSETEDNIAIAINIPKENLVFTMDFKNELGCVVFDEFHYINDINRGHVWENCIMMLPSHIQLLMLSATLDKPEKIAKWIENRYTYDKEVCIMSTTHRSVPLTHYNFITASTQIFKIFEKNEGMKQLINDGINKLSVIQTADGVFNEIQYHKMTKILTLLEQKNVYMKMPFVLNKVLEYMKINNMLPAICFILSRKQIERMSQEITVKLLNGEETYNVKQEAESIIRKKLLNYDEYLMLPEYIELIGLLEKGIGKHHAGMMPILREIVELFLEKNYIKVLLTTETFAIGVNFAIKTVIFTDVNKFDGNITRMLHGHEFTQMSGRAGRLGIDTVGNVIHLNNLFKNVDLTSYKNMMKGTPLKLTSRFSFSYNNILNVLSNNLQSNNLHDKLQSNSILDFCSKSMIQEDINTELEQILIHINETKDEIAKLENNIMTMKTPIDTIVEYININNNNIIRKKDKTLKIKSLTENNINIVNDSILYTKYTEKKEQLLKLQIEYNNTKQYINDTIILVVDFLVKEGFICYNNTSNINIITNKGKYACQLKEVHCLVFANLLADGKLDTLCSKQLAGIFSCFTNIIINDDIKIFIPNCDDMIQPILEDINCMYEKYSRYETSIMLNTMIDYSINFDIIYDIIRWCECKDANECREFLKNLAEEKGIFLGEFIKAIMKICNIAKELEKVTEMMGHLDLLSKLQRIPSLLQKYVAVNQSLYI